MILIDTSAWVEFLRDTASTEADCVQDLLETGASVACCDPVRMELFAGARDERQLTGLHRLLARTYTLPTTPADFDAAAAYFRACRARGTSVRRTTDCLIASVAISNDVPLLHCDRDFDALAAATPLVCHPPRVP